MPRDRRLAARVGIAVMLTAVLTTSFFSYMHFELYGEVLCRQKYDLPPFSFYAERLDCFVFIGDVAADAGRIAVVVSVPLLLSGVVALCVAQWRRRRKRGGGSDAEPAPVDAARPARLFFWIVNVSLALPLGLGLALWVVGRPGLSLGGVFGVVLFYGVHLYPAGLLAFGVVQGVSWLWRTAMVAAGRTR